MAFFEFYFIFFPLVVVIFYLTRKFSYSGSSIILLLSSIAFLFFADSVSLLLLLSIAFFNFFLIKLIRSGFYKKTLMFIGVSASLLPLIVYKSISLDSTDFTSDNLHLFYSAGIPLGLSFYALQQITAIFEGSSSKEGEISLRDYFVFSLFFVYLSSGPISFYRKILPQINYISKAKIPVEHFNMGVGLFIMGFSKKVLIADPINDSLNAFFALAASPIDIAFSILELSYISWGSALQFYFEFSAYSDMAIGMGLCFGILLPVNFNSPLKSSTPVEYINSWHMSFMNFVREYVFQPVFKLSKKIPVGSLEKRYIFAWAIAVFMTFLTTGIWHAPTPSAMLYSLYAAFLLVVFQLALLRFNRIKKTRLFFLNQIFSRFLLLISTISLFTFIRAPAEIDVYSFFASNFDSLYISLPSALDFISPLIFGVDFRFDGFFPSYIYLRVLDWNPVDSFQPSYAVIHIFVTTLIVFFMPNSMEIFGLIDSDKFSIVKIRWKDNVVSSLLFGFILVISILMFKNNTGFIYGL